MAMLMMMMNEAPELRVPSVRPPVGPPDLPQALGLPQVSLVQVGGEAEKMNGEANVAKPDKERTAAIGHAKTALDLLRKARAELRRSAVAGGRSLPAYEHYLDGDLETLQNVEANLPLWLGALEHSAP